MDRETWTRRRLLAGVGGLGLGVVGAPLAALASGGRAPSGPGPREAFQRLKEGNERFVLGRPRGSTDLPGIRRALAAGQRPFATIVGCSDSRVPPELVFDQGLGQLFVVRVAGNLADEDAIGSVQYAVHHLGTSLVVVLGHEKCGAVSAALGSAEERAREPKQVRQLLEQIRPAIPGSASAGSRDEQVHAVVEANVRRNVKALEAVADLRALAGEGKIKLVGAVYDLGSGHVRWLL